MTKHSIYVEMCAAMQCFQWDSPLLCRLEIKSSNSPGSMERISYIKIGTDVMESRFYDIKISFNQSQLSLQLNQKEKKYDPP